MAVASALSLDGGSSDLYEDSISSGHSFDSLDELLSRFTLDFRPEYVLKFRNRYDLSSPLKIEQTSQKPAAVDVSVHLTPPLSVQARSTRCRH